MACKIAIAGGGVALADAEDARVLGRYMWSLHSSGYAQAGIRGFGKQVAIKMHRAVIFCPDGFEVDHINGNRLDNRRANLRVVTHAVNMQNTRRGQRRAA